MNILNPFAEICFQNYGIDTNITSSVGFVICKTSS